MYECSVIKRMNSEILHLTLLLKLMILYCLLEICCQIPRFVTSMPAIQEAEKGGLQFEATLGKMLADLISNTPGVVVHTVSSDTPEVAVGGLWSEAGQDISTRPV
jgi:hypothetical protein